MGLIFILPLISRCRYDVSVIIQYLVGSGGNPRTAVVCMVTSFSLIRNLYQCKISLKCDAVTCAFTNDLFPLRVSMAPSAMFVVLIHVD